MLSETEILYACIAMNHNSKIIDNALNKLKQFSKDGDIFLYNKDGNIISFPLRFATCL